MEPPTPPGLLITLMFTFHTFAISPETMRLQTSVPPPADQTTVFVMSRMGNFFSAASPQLAKTNRNKTINDRYFFIASSFLEFLSVELVVKNSETMIHFFPPNSKSITINFNFRLTSFFTDCPLDRGGVRFNRLSQNPILQPFQRFDGLFLIDHRLKFSGIEAFDDADHFFSRGNGPFKGVDGAEAK